MSLARLVSVHVWILHRRMQQVSICESVCLPCLSGSSKYLLYPISSKAYLSYTYMGLWVSFDTTVPDMSVDRKGKGRMAAT